MRRWIVSLSIFVGTAALALACSVGRDCDSGLCDGAPVAVADGGDVGFPVKPPDGCVETAEPKDSPNCVASGFGIFVSPRGKQDGSGKIDDPVNTIAAAIAKTGSIRRIYICEGSFDERVVLKAGISLYGGFKCDGWGYDARIRPTVGKTSEPGYALDVQSVAGAFEISDLEFVAGNGNEAFPNSIAARFVRTSGTVLRRVKLTAGDGAPGANGDAGVSGTTVKHTDFTGTVTPFDPTGSPGTAGAAGAGKSCKCPNAPASEVTAGAGGGTAPTGAGQKGEPINLPATGADDGAGGVASAPNCGVGDGTGHTGATRAQATGGAVPIRLGTIDADGWKAESGGAGATGLPGQGGGGGSGQSAGGGGAGSGGGCGGCGGFGGKAGTGAGASIALLAIDSPIRFGGELATGKGGRGGDGGEGGSRGDGGNHGLVTSGTGCQGGNGGKGGKGGGGSGGAGGLSVGVLTSGNAPVTDGATFTLGSAGDGGTGKSTNSGPPGVRAETAKVEVVSKGTSM